jgi:hypothetical protein
MGPRQMQIIPEKFDEQSTPLNIPGNRLAIYYHGYILHLLLPLCYFFWARLESYPFFIA